MTTPQSTYVDAAAPLPEPASPEHRRSIALAAGIVGVLVLVAGSAYLLGTKDDPAAVDMGGDSGTTAVTDEPTHFEATYLPPGFGFESATDVARGMDMAVSSFGVLDGAPAVVYTDPDVRLGLVVQTMPSDQGLESIFLGPVPEGESLTVRGQPAQLWPLYGFVDEHNEVDDGWADHNYAFSWVEADGTRVLVSSSGVSRDEGLRTAEDLVPINDDAWTALLERPAERDGSGTLETEAVGYLVLTEEAGAPSIGVRLDRWTSVPDAPAQLSLVLSGGNSEQSLIVDEWVDLEIVAVSFPPAYVAGVVTPDAATVDITTDTGETFTLPTGPPTDVAFGRFPKEFFIAELDADVTEVTAIVRDGQGEELTRATSSTYTPGAGPELPELTGGS